MTCASRLKMVPVNCSGTLPRVAGAPAAPGVRWCRRSCHASPRIRSVTESLSSPVPGRRMDLSLNNFLPFLLTALVLCSGSGGGQKIKAQPPLHKRCEEKAKATSGFDQTNDNCQTVASNPQPPALKRGSNSGNQYWRSVLVPLYQRATCGIEGSNYLRT